MALLPGLGGCSRQHYRLQADRDVYHLVKEKSNDPRWALPGFKIDQDPRARYFDPTNPDREPMPLDDPYSHEYMRKVDGKRGYKYWLKDGVNYALENPNWRELMGEYADVTPEGALKLTLEDAVLAAQINSPAYRSQIEQLFLSALDVSAERFRFDSQFFGYTNPFFTTLGRLRPGGDQTILQDNNNLSVQRTFATGGQLLVQFANSFVWTFAGPNTNSAFSIASFNLTQPLLRFGGKARVLEQLTIVERALLANLRAFERYRQGFYTNVVVGDLGVETVQRRGGFFGGTGLTGFTGTGSGGFGGVGDVTGFGRGGFGGGVGGGGQAGGQGFAGGGAGTVGGFIGLQQQMQQIRNRQTNLDLQLRTLALLEANFEAGLIDLIQVDQFRQSIETERALLLQVQNQLQTSLDTFKAATLGLPPNLKLEVDDSVIRQFRLIDPRVTDLQSELADFIEQFGRTQANPPIPELEQAIATLEQVRGRVEPVLKLTHEDIAKFESTISVRLPNMLPADRDQLLQDKRRLEETLSELETRYAQNGQQLAALRSQLRPDNLAAVADGVVSASTGLNGLVQELSLIQARARLESVYVDPVRLTPEEAIQIARCNRLDWMNNRAALVDSWRLITFNANALLSNLNVTFSGDIHTVGDNPVKFRAPNGDMSVGVQFDAPFTRLLERNNYRSVLISYQQDRRTLIQYQDGVYRSLRATLRNLDQLRTNLEIQRRAVVIAVRRVDQTREVLNEPPPPAQPGQAAQQLGPTAALDLLRALQDLRDTQDNFMSVWLNYYAARMTLARDLGIMQLDERGLWIDQPIVAADWMCGDIDCAIPPAVPLEWLNQAGVTADYEQLPQTPAPEQATPTTAPMANASPEAAEGTLPPPVGSDDAPAEPPASISEPAAAPPTDSAPPVDAAQDQPMAGPASGNSFSRGWSWLTGKSTGAR
ncbi:MAG: hypothetical protein U0836_02590 [Pirellulales bacterium]